nr:aldolase/citrate lyase family protein [Kineococcus siccus]
MLRSPAVAALLAASGVDWICLDAQHGEHDDASVLDVCSRRHDGVRVLVRPPSNDAAWIGRALDAGADGVVVPMVDSAADARAAVHACRYPPLGGRSWGPLGGLHARPVPAADAANRAVSVAVMVETAAALAVVDDIAATPGVDEVFVGPFDLSLTLGRDVDDLVADPAADAPLRRVVAACARAGVRAAAFGATADRSSALLDLGFTSVVVTTDAAALSLGAASVVTAVRRGARAAGG